MDQHEKVYVFFVDNKEYQHSSEHILGSEIKTIAAVPAGYGLFEEGEGAAPDRQISDPQKVELGGHHPKHFYTVPPATFG